MIKSIKLYFGNATIHKKLLLSYGLIVLIPIFSFGIYSYHSAKKNYIVQTQVSMEDAANSFRAALENSIQRENDNLRYLTYNVELRSNLEEIGKTQDIAAAAKKLSDQAKPVFWYFISQNTSLKKIRVFSSNLTSDIGEFFFVIDSIEKTDWYKESQVYFSTIWRFTEDKIYASRPLLDTDSASKPIGIIQLELDVKKLVKPIRSVHQEMGGVVLTDGKGNLIYKTPLNHEKQDLEIQEFLVRGKHSDFDTTKNFLIFTSEALSNGWKIHYLRNRDIINSQLQNFLLTTLLVMLSSIAFLLLLGILVSRVFSRRILKLKKAAEEISMGNFQVEMDLTFKDEIGIVNRSFDEMQKKMNAMITKTYQLGMEKRQAELAALQARINPHFLYNCLSSIKWMAIKKGEDDIAEITGLVAKFYRSTLNGGNAITTVENELETVFSYLEIQKMTHDYSFDIELDLDQRGRETKIPSFLLQPMVENAIKHGIDNLDEDQRGKVMVLYRKEGDFLLFQVKNTVKSADLEILSRQLAKPQSGYGLQSIHDRLRLYYQDGNSFFENTTEENMVVFTLKLNCTMKEIGI